MNFFGNVFDSLSRGYKAANEKATPSIAELQGLRGRMVAQADDTAKVRSGEQQAALRQNLLEVDGMIARATRTADRAAARVA